MSRLWKPGDQVLVRDVEFGDVHSASPCTVVEDGDQQTVLYLSAGTPCRLPDGWRYDLPPPQPVTLREIEWRGHNDMVICAPRTLHGVILRWDLSGELIFWYINLQAPFSRTELGFDFWDKALDIVISPDLQSWRWKDEDHFEQAQASGQISREEAALLRVEGERVLDLARHRKPPFCNGWEHWRPDPSWPIPALPNGWDRLDI